MKNGRIIRTKTIKTGGKHFGTLVNSAFIDSGMKHFLRLPDQLLVSSTGKTKIIKTWVRSPRGKKWDPRFYSTHPSKGDYPLMPRNCWIFHS